MYVLWCSPMVCEQQLAFGLLLIKCTSLNLGVVGRWTVQQFQAFPLHEHMLVLEIDRSMHCGRQSDPAQGSLLTMDPPKTNA